MQFLWLFSKHINLSKSLKDNKTIRLHTSLNVTKEKEKTEHLFHNIQKMQSNYKFDLKALQSTRKGHKNKPYKLSVGDEKYSTLPLNFTTRFNIVLFIFIYDIALTKV